MKRFARIGFLVLAAAAAACDSTEGDLSGGITLAATLAPQIAVDASGRADFDDHEGTANDLLDVEIEVHSGGFLTLGIDAGDGFADEDAVLVGRRAGQVVLSMALPFSEDRRVGGVGDITFEGRRSGLDTPDLEDQDVLEVTLNGTLLLRGTLQ